MICARCNTLIPHGTAACPACNASAAPAVARTYGLYIFGVLIVMGYAVVLLALMSPGYAPPPQVADGLTFWSAAYGYYRAKKLGGSRWKSAIVGAFLGLAMFMMAAFISGLRT